MNGRRTTRIGLGTSLAVLLLSSMLLATACDDKSSEEELCGDLDDVARALKSIQDVSPDSATEDLRQVRADLEEAIDNVRESASEVPEVQELEDAFDSFAAAIERLPDGVDVEEAIRDIGEEVTNLTAAFQNLRDAVDCE